MLARFALLLVLVFPSQRPSVVWLRVSSVEPKNAQGGAALNRFGVTRKEAATIVDSLPNVAEVIPVREMNQGARALNRDRNVRVVGTNAAFSKVTSVVISRGRFISESDNRQRESVAVIGWAAAKHFFPDKNAIGQTVRLGKQVFKVVGQLTEEGTSKREELGNAVIIPIETMRSRFGDIVFESEGGAFKTSQYELSRLELLLKDPAAIGKTEKQVKELLERLHKQTADVRIAALEAPQTVPPKNVRRQGRKPGPVLEQGVLESANTVTLSSPLPGTSRILRLAPEGQAVRKGDVVAELQSRETSAKLSDMQVEHARTEAQLALTEQELNLARLLSQSAEKTSKLMMEAAELEKQNILGPKGEHAVQVKSATREAEAAEAEIVFAQKVAKAAGGVGNATQLAEAQFRMTQAKGRLGNAKDRLAMLNGPTKALREKTIELKLAETKSAAETLLANHKGKRLAAEAELAGFKTRMNVLQAQLGALKDQVKASAVVSPIDGVLIYATSSNRRSSTPPLIRVGAEVRERQQLVRIADPKDLQVRVRVHESKIRRVRVGQKCEIVVDALPNEKLAGTVKSVAKTPVPGKWPNPDLKEYITVVSIEPLESLIMGMTCDVTFKD